MSKADAAAAAAAQEAAGEAQAEAERRRAAVAAMPWKPAVGERVLVAKLGGHAIVSSIQKKKLQVEFGRMSLSVKLSDVAKA